MLKSFVDEKYIDKSTGLMGYATWGIMYASDAEVDSIYLTCYSAMSDLIGLSHFGVEGVACRNFMAYRKLIMQYVHQETKDKALLHRYPHAGFTYSEGSEAWRPKEARFNHPSNLSGDNTIPFIILAGELKMTTLVKKLFKAHVSRGFFYQNKFTNNGEVKFVPDFMLFHTSIFIRSAGVLAPLLYLTDLMLLMNIVIHVLASHYKADNTASEMNFYFSLVQSERNTPTFWSKLAIWVYKKRAKIYCDSKGRRSIYNGKGPITRALTEFFTLRGDKRPPMHTYLAAVTALYFGEK